MSVRIGYACISDVMKERNIYTNRTTILKNLSLNRAQELALKNVRDLAEIIKYNESIGIRFYRLTSNLFPHLGNPRGVDYNIDFAREDLAAAGKLARDFGHRLTMHPGQFAQIGSPRVDVVRQTEVDLTNHAAILSAMGMTPRMGSVLIIHGGGVYENKPETLARWRENFLRLDVKVSQYVALENDEYSYDVADLLPLCEDLGIPLCIDFFHYEVMNGAIDDKLVALFPRVINTWKKRGIKPKCHWSNQRLGARPGSHDDYIECIPDVILKFARDFDVDIMCECKKHDLCALKILKQHFNRIVVNGVVYWELAGG